jgi:hypothetical protein
MVLQLDNNRKTIFSSDAIQSNGATMGSFWNRRELVAVGLGPGSCLGEGLINRGLAEPKPARSEEIAADIASLSFAIGGRRYQLDSCMDWLTGPLKTSKTIEDNQDHSAGVAWSPAG